MKALETLILKLLALIGKKRVLVEIRVRQGRRLR
jgi:hypothetical protein